MTVALVLRQSGAESFLEVAALATGRGTGFRIWMPARVALAVGPTRQPPTAASQFGVSKAAVTNDRPALLFAAIDARYEAAAGCAAARPAAACTVPGGGGALTAGARLLAASARSEVTGWRGTFDVTGHGSQLYEATLALAAANTEPAPALLGPAPRQVRFRIPLRFAAPDHGSA